MKWPIEHATLGLLSWCPTIKLSHCNSFEAWAPIDFMYRCLIFKRVAVTWLHGRVPGHRFQWWLLANPGQRRNQCAGVTKFLDQIIMDSFTYCVSCIFALLCFVYIISSKSIKKWLYLYHLKLFHWNWENCMIAQNHEITLNKEM